MTRKKALIIIGALVLLSLVAVIMGRIHNKPKTGETDPPETETMAVFSGTETGGQDNSTSETGESDEDTPEEAAKLSPDEIISAEELLSEGVIIIEETKPVSPDLKLYFDLKALDDVGAKLPFEVSEDALHSVMSWYVSQLGYTKEVNITISPVFDYDKEFRTYHYLADLNGENECVLLYNILYRAWSCREVSQ